MKKPKAPPPATTWDGRKLVERLKLDHPVEISGENISTVRKAIEVLPATDRVVGFEPVVGGSTTLKVFPLTGELAEVAEACLWWARLGKPRVHLTNAATVSAARRGADSVKTSASLGWGGHFSIMAKPRQEYGETGEGQVWTLAPLAADLDAIKAGALSVSEYRARYLGGPFLGDDGRSLLEGPRSWQDVFAPGKLSALSPRFGEPVLVRSGDTLTCSCSREAAEAGECHRVWAAREVLASAGWEVVLDGRLVVQASNRRDLDQIRPFCESP